MPEPAVTFEAGALRSLLAEVYGGVPDSERTRSLTSRKLVVAFAFREPQLRMVVDGRGERAAVSFDSDLQPHVTFHLAGATIHPFFTGELNAMRAVMDGQLRIEGPLLTALAIYPAMPEVQAEYRRVYASQRGQEPIP